MTGEVIDIGNTIYGGPKGLLSTLYDENGLNEAVDKIVAEDSDLAIFVSIVDDWMKARVEDNPRLAGAAYQLLERVLASREYFSKDDSFEQNCIQLLTAISTGYDSITNRPIDDSLSDPNIPALSRVAFRMKREFPDSEDVTVAVRDAMRISLMAGKTVWDREMSKWSHNMESHMMKRGSWEDRPQFAEAVLLSNPMQMLADLFASVRDVSGQDTDVRSIVLDVLDCEAITMFAKYLNTIPKDLPVDVESIRYISEIVRCGQELGGEDPRRGAINELVESLINFVSTRERKLIPDDIVTLFSDIREPRVEALLAGARVRIKEDKYRVKKEGQRIEVRKTLTSLRDAAVCGSYQELDMSVLGDMSSDDYEWFISDAGGLSRQKRLDLACFWAVTHMVVETSDVEADVSEVREKWISKIVESLNIPKMSAIHEKTGFVALRLLIALVLHENNWTEDASIRTYFEPALVAARKLREDGKLDMANALVRWIPTDEGQNILSEIQKEEKDDLMRFIQGVIVKS